MPVKEVPKLALIIPAWNEAAYLTETLLSVNEAVAGLTDVNVQVIVVDNNSTDQTASLARNAGATVVFEPINQIARARNAGAAAAADDTRWFIFLDADTRLTRGLLRVAINRLAGGKVVGGGVRLEPDRSLRGLPALLMSCWNALARRARLAAGCFVYCRADAFRGVGGFSESVYAGEEIFLSRQLNRWASRRGMRFEVIQEPPVVTSVRKLDWYTPAQLVRQSLLVLIPGAMFSRRLCGTWYDAKGTRDRSARSSDVGGRVDRDRR